MGYLSIYIEYICRNNIVFVEPHLYSASDRQHFFTWPQVSQTELHTQSMWENCKLPPTCGSFLSFLTFCYCCVSLFHLISISCIKQIPPEQQSIQYNVWRKLFSFFSACCDDSSPTLAPTKRCIRFESWGVQALYFFYFNSYTFKLCARYAPNVIFNYSFLRWTFKNHLEISYCSWNSVISAA